MKVVSDKFTNKIEQTRYKIDLALGKFVNSKGFQMFSKYVVWGIAGLMLILAISLPYITLNSGQSYTLFELPALASQHGNAQLAYIASINVIAVAVVLAGFAFYVVEEVVRKNQKHNYLVSKIFGIAIFALCFAHIITVFFFKSGIEGAGLDSGFMMNQVGFSFVALFLCLVILAFKFFSRGKLAVNYILLITLCIIWLLPLLFIIFTSFRAERGFYTDSFVPDKWSFDAYERLFTDTSIFMFGRWFLNTLIVAVCTCVLSTIIIVSISYVLSRFDFKSKKFLTSMMLIIGMFPGFMSMIAIYYIIKSLNLSESLFALILCYSGGSASGYYVVKGFIDTIPRDIDEAAMIDGASKAQIFFKMILPLAKPIVIYTILTSFMSPWGDYIFASVIMGDAYESYTVALGLYMMLQNSYINSWYTSFAAGAVLVAVPISILFIALNKYYVEGLSGSVKG